MSRSYFISMMKHKDERIVHLKAKVAELENVIAKCERVIRVPDNLNTVDDYDLGA